MTLEEVETLVEEIAAKAGDDESAHSLEDDLYTAVLEHIAENIRRRDGGPAPWVLARAALKARQIQFHRWCA